MAQGQMNGASNETRTHSRGIASLANHYTTRSTRVLREGGGIF